MGGDGDDDDGDHHNDDGPSGTESDNSESGSEHSRESSDEDETSDYEGAAEDVPPPPPGHGLVRTESVRRKKQADEMIDSFIDDDDDIELLEARLKIMKAKKKANNIFTVSEEEFGNVQDRLESAMKYAVRNEVWNLITKGHHLQLRRELLKDKVSRNECIDHFFRVNNVSHRMSRMASAAAKVPSTTLAMKTYFARRLPGTSCALATSARPHERTRTRQRWSKCLPPAKHVDESAINLQSPKTSRTSPCTPPPSTTARRRSIAASPSRAALMLCSTRHTTSKSISVANRSKTSSFERGTKKWEVGRWEGA